MKGRYPAAALELQRKALRDQEARELLRLKQTLSEREHEALSLKEDEERLLACRRMQEAEKLKELLGQRKRASDLLREADYEAKQAEDARAISKRLSSALAREREAAHLVEEAKARLAERSAEMSAQDAHKDRWQRVEQQRLENAEEEEALEMALHRYRGSGRGSDS